MAKKFNPNTERKTTPKSFTVGETAHKSEGAGEYPNQIVTKTRSGHTIIYDDSKDNETISFQHRTGSSLEMRPDGGIHLTSHNSQYNVVFGEHRMTITGAHDMHVKGDASMRIYGDVNHTIHGNYNLTVLGDHNITSKNMNSHIRGNYDQQAKNQNIKVEGTHSILAKGAIAHVAKDGATFASRTGHVNIAGGAGANFAVPNQGNMTFDVANGGHYTNVSGGNLEVKQSDQPASLSSAGVEQVVSMIMQSGILHMVAQKTINAMAQQGDIHVKALTGDVQVAATSGDAQVTAGGKAGLSGSTTHVSGQQDVHVSSSGGSVNVDPGGGEVNLAGGLSEIMQQLELGLSDLMSGGIPNIELQPANLAKVTDEGKPNWV